MGEDTVYTAFHERRWDGTRTFFGRYTTEQATDFLLKFRAECPIGYEALHDAGDFWLASGMYPKLFWTDNTDPKQGIVDENPRWEVV